MRIHSLIQIPLFITLLLSCNDTYGAPELSLDNQTSQMLGKYLIYFQEQEARLPLTDVISKFEKGEGKLSSGDATSLGIGVNPVWLKTTVHNPSALESLYRLSVETPWLDNIETWYVQNGKIIKHVIGGDALDFDDRPMPYKYYAFESTFPAGKTHVYIRIDSLGPMAIPVRLSTVERAISRDIGSAYEYGLLYGIMLALALYNFVLYTNIRQKEFGLYGLYLIGFVANSLSYTGQIHQVITPDWGPYFQDWTDIFLMITYSVFGLHFARFALYTKSYAPMLNRVTFWVATAIPLGMLAGALVNQLVFSMILAFILNSSFAILFIVLGYQAYKHKVPSAILFFVSSVTAATCIGISTMAVAGLVPYNDFTFKAIEVGMTFEAILLALLLAQRFRAAQRDKVIAETFARTDDLTHLLNRHGFKETCPDVWRECQYEKQDCSIVLLDVDKFANLNSEYGHATGDLVLHSVAKCLQQKARSIDILARWGGEEFILLLPKVNQLQAILLAEDMRHAIESHAIPYGGEQIKITASVGVAGSNLQYFNSLPLKDCNLEQLISGATDALYNAKTAGRNQVYASHLVPQI